MSMAEKKTGRDGDRPVNRKLGKSSGGDANSVPSPDQLAAYLSRAVWQFSARSWDAVRARIGADFWPSRIPNIGIAKIIRPGAGLFKIGSHERLFRFHESLWRGLNPKPGDSGWAIIIPCYRDGQLIDLIAWPLSKRAAADRTYRFTGEARYLGYNWISHARRSGRTVPMRRSVLEWLRHAGRGVAVLTDDVRELRGLMLEFGSSVPHRQPRAAAAWDRQFQARIERLLALPDPQPRTSAPASLANAARAREARLRQYQEQRLSLACQDCGQLINNGGSNDGAI
jgi:hypothetical protein